MAVIRPKDNKPDRFCGNYQNGVGDVITTQIGFEQREEREAKVSFEDADATMSGNASTKVADWSMEFHELVSDEAPDYSRSPTGGNSRERSRKGTSGRSSSNTTVEGSESPSTSARDASRRKLEEGSRQLQGKIDELRSSKRKLAKELETSHAELKALNNKLNEERLAFEQMRVHCGTQIAEYQQRENVHASDRQLLAQRTQELQSAQNYLNPARLYSGAELINLAEALNTEVFNVAASIVDMADIEIDDKCTPLDGFDSWPGHDEIKFMLEEAILGPLEAAWSKRSYDTFRAILQSALQAIISKHLVQMVNAYAIPHSEQSNYLEGLHNGIRESAALPTIAGRWRAMTKAQSKLASYTTIEKTVGYHLIQSVALVLSTAGKWTSEVREQKLHSSGRLYEAMESGIREILDRAGRLDRALSDTIDEDWTVFLASPGENYNQEAMEDAFGTSSTRRRSPTSSPIPVVFCSTDLGLSKTTWLPPSTITTERIEDHRVMLKAKVVLQDTIMESLKETNRTQFR
ncbi:hypothetical protein AAF712_009919 [Marasmius tenuissimus]|uniref:Uncharacterized protein n=1 Tax=Marasmius tenuissimus TaxID=585030 RepID=A0ABR2ZNT8_9AGAR